MLREETSRQDAIILANRIVLSLRVSGLLKQENVETACEFVCSELALDDIAQFFRVTASYGFSIHTPKRNQSWFAIATLYNTEMNRIGSFSLELAPGSRCQWEYELPRRIKCNIPEF